MERSETGKYELTAVGGEQVRAFILSPLPPAPALVMAGQLQPLLEACVFRRS